MEDLLKMLPTLDAAEREAVLDYTVRKKSGHHSSNAVSRLGADVSWPLGRAVEDMALSTALGLEGPSANTTTCCITAARVMNIHANHACRRTTKTQRRHVQYEGVCSFRPATTLAVSRQFRPRQDREAVGHRGNRVS